MNYIKYARTFVMMEEQTADFAARQGPIKGYLKIETGNNKGALRCVVQNIKFYCGGEYIYKLILFGKKRDRVINSVFGSLAINRQGNGETYFRFNPLDVDGKGSSFADFSMAIVAAVSGNDDKEALQPVLKGFMRKADAENEQAGNDIEEVVATDLESIRDDVVLSEAMESNRQDEKKEEIKEEIKDAPNYNRFYNEYLLHFCRYTCKSAEYYEDVFPFEKDLTDARWKRIQNVASLPLVSPGAHYFASQYRHFLFGAKPDSEGIACRYYLAVPGRFIKEEQPDGGRSGFVFWQPVEGVTKTVKDAGYGYWIVAIDAFNGDIIEAH